MAATAESKYEIDPNGYVTINGDDIDQFGKRFENFLT